MLLTIIVTRAEKPLALLPVGLGSPGPWSPALLAAGITAAVTGLARLAIAGFAPGGHLPTLALAAYPCGIAAVLLSGHATPRPAAAVPGSPQPVRRRLPAGG